jgi:hypothetical protein
MRALDFQQRLFGVPAVLRVGRRARLDSLALLASAGLAAAFIVGFIVAALFRLSYPFALQLTEPASLTQVERVLRGQPLYVQPTLDYVPQIYGPLYFYLSALPALVLGPTYAPLRLVSLLASMGTLLLIGRLVQRETGSPLVALVAAGLYAATYPFTETTLDMGRVDALFTFWLVAAVFAARSARFHPTQATMWLVLSGGLVGVAGLTKLPLGALPLGLGLLGWAVLAYRARAVWFALAALAVVGIGLLSLRAVSGPWPTWYLWDLPRLHEVRSDLVGRFWFSDALPRLFVSVVLGPVFLLLCWLRRDLLTIVFYLLVAGALLSLSWISRGNGGGATNVLLPGFAILAILLGLGLFAALNEIPDHSARARLGRAYLAALCIGQFALLVYNPRITVPYRSDQWADERLATTLASLPERILAVDLDSYLHGHAESDHPMFGPIGEIQGEFGGPGTPEGHALAADIHQRLQAHAYSYVVVYASGCCLKDELLSAGYRDRGPLFPPDDIFYDWKTVRTPDPEVWESPDRP